MKELNHPQAQGEERPRILLIDDEPKIITALHRELHQELYEVVAFTNPREVPEAFSQGEFALVVSDNLMPGLTGLELLRQIKSLSPLTRRVLLTGQTETDQAIKAFNDGDIHRFVNKPWNKPEMLALIREEMEIYQRQKLEIFDRAHLEQTAKKRTAQLGEVVIELKQTQTQLVLHKDQAMAGQEPIPPRFCALKYLVVEGHAGVRGTIVSILQKAGVTKCKGVAGGKEALAYLNSAPPVDVILSEWNMAEMDGLALLRAVKELPTLSSQANFILTTPRENRESFKLAIKAGVDGYLIKPFRLRTLVDQLTRIRPKKSRESLEEKILELRLLTFVVANADIEGRYQIRKLLASSGVQYVTLVDNGQKALHCVKEKRAYALIYDCNLQDPYWLELNETMRRLGIPGGPPALIVTSATPSKKELEQARQAGLTNFVTGPFQRLALFEAILEARVEETN